MTQNIIFISDLHISIEKGEITRRFISFLKSQIGQATAIYILGDLFDTWVGDDDATPPNNKIKSQLKKLSESGTKIFLQLGNRDFLIGKKFCNDAGITLLNDYEVIELNGVKTLLTHGDLLCSDDIAYQQFRVKSRSKEWQQNVLSKPLLIRLLAARWYRFRSHFHKKNKSQEIMDVNHQTVINEMQKHHCLRLIHGHTHRPAIHDLEIDGQTANRFVLAEWKKDSAQLLRWTSKGYEIENLS